MNVESVRTLDRQPIADAISRYLDQRVAVAEASIDLLLAQISSGHRLGDRRVLTPTLVSRDSVAPPRP